MPVSIYDGGGGVNYEGSDHRSQVITIHPEASGEEGPSRLQPFAWKRMDKAAVEDLADIVTLPGPLQTPGDIDQAVEHLVTQLKEVAQEAVPNRSGNPPKQGLGRGVLERGNFQGR